MNNMANICMFYHTPTGCGRGDRCGFFHLTESAHRRVISAKQIRKHAFTGICTHAITDNCTIPNCEFLHPSDDIRCTINEHRHRVLEDDNSFLCTQIKEMEQTIEKLKESARIDRKYISTLKDQRKKLIRDVESLEENAKKDKEIIGRLKRENNTERKTIIIRRYLKLEMDKKKETEDFIPLGRLPSEAMEPVSVQPVRPSKRIRYFKPDV